MMNNTWNPKLWSACATALLAVLCTCGVNAKDLAASPSVPALLDFYAANSPLPVAALDGAELQRLLQGEAIVKMSGKASAAAADEIVGVGVYGFKIIEAPRLPIWLAVMGGNDERDYRLKTAMLSRGDAGSYTRYQYINLPWPVRDRHYVIHCTKIPQVAAASRGLIWEHRWQLQDDGEALLHNALLQQRVPELAVEDVRDAIYLQENRGAWTMFDLGEQRTLVVAYVNADLGGRFPASVVRHFARSRLKSGLASLRELGSRVHLNYTEDRLIHDGFGRPVSREAALQAASNWHGAVQIASRDHQ